MNLNSVAIGSPNGIQRWILLDHCGFSPRYRSCGISWGYLRGYLKGFGWITSKIVAGKKNFCGNKGTCFEVKVLPSGWWLPQNILVFVLPNHLNSFWMRGGSSICHWVELVFWAKLWPSVKRSCTESLLEAQTPRQTRRQAFRPPHRNGWHQSLLACLASIWDKHLTELATSIREPKILPNNVPG